MINIKGLDKAEVLAALYNSTHVQGMGFLQAKSGDMSIEDAKQIIKNGHTYFDYVYGRVMKVDLSKDEFNECLYDRDNGNGAAWNALINAGLIKSKGGY